MRKTQLHDSFNYPILSSTTDESFSHFLLKGLDESTFGLM